MSHRGRSPSLQPFTAAPTNESKVHEWTTGPIFYSSIFVAEAFGKSGSARVKDLLPNGENDQTPAYAVYENDKLARMALINFMTDASGANDYTATISVGGGTFSEPNGVPASVKVKYLLASSVSEKDNITWAGQVSPALFCTTEAVGRKYLTSSLLGTDARCAFPV